MPKHEPLTPKAISNRIKAKGLQKLRWYCQMCQKQCRDQNGFKCHLTSESHQRQLLLFSECPGRYMNEFSREFEKTFLDILRRQFGSKRVRANAVYQEYIKSRHHVHMNATGWYTLTGFINYLGRVGICKVDKTEKGWYIQYVDQEVERRREKMAKKVQMDKDYDERQQDLVMRQAELAKTLEDQRTDAAAGIQSDVVEFKRDEGDKIEFKLKKSVDAKTPAPELPTPFSALRLLTNRSRCSSVVSSACSSSRSDRMSTRSALDEIMDAEERRKEMQNRKHCWLHENIVVKIVTSKFGAELKGSKAVVVAVDEDSATATVRLLNNDRTLDVHQLQLETVIPALKRLVLIVNGAYRGCKAILDNIDMNAYCVTVTISEGLSRGRVVHDVAYEDVCKLHSS